MHGGYAYMLTISATVTYFVACCYYIRGCCAAFKQMLEETDQLLVGVGGKSADKKEMEINIKQAIAFHIKIMEYELASTIYMYHAIIIERGSLSGCFTYYRM